jgi:hypothetical protein
MAALWLIFAEKLFSLVTLFGNMVVFGRIERDVG